MGWLWSSGTGTGIAPKGNTPAPNSSSTTETQSAPSSEPTYSDPEIAKFMAQIQSEFGGSDSTRNNSAAEPKAQTSGSSSPSSSSSSSSSSWWPSRGASSSTQPTQTSTPSPSTIPSSSSSSSSQTSAQAPPARLDPLSESLLPTTMSCRQAFDHAYHCNSLGGQWTAVYRAGTVRSCSEQWDDFWFCMRTRAYSGPVKEEAIKDYYRQKELNKYGSGKPNSTDIWEPRAERLPAGSVFQERYVKPDISDEEWYRLEIERQRMVRRMLKEEEERTASSSSSSS
ncbi:hypothetical protein F5B21DRAFT_167710 [Xylaria acuta]|nr:hypothetical protein F5B21DRAFT_167710 [Xylaria acuta]